MCIKTAQTSDLMTFADTHTHTQVWQWVGATSNVWVQLGRQAASGVLTTNPLAVSLAAIHSCSVFSEHQNIKTSVVNAVLVLVPH